jgi:hypothetical protein
MHHYILFIRGEPVWNAFELSRLMLNLVMDARIRAHNQDSPFLMTDEARQEARNKIEDSLRAGVGCVEHLIEDRNS